MRVGLARPMPESCVPAEPAELTFQGRDGVITACHCVEASSSCEEFSLKGVNWEGAEGVDGVPGGLAENALSFYFSFLRRHKFNAARISFNHKSVRDNLPISTKKISRTLNGNLFADSDGELGVSYIEMLRQVASAAAEHDVLILLTAGRLTPTSWPGEGLWYSREIPEATLPQLWSKLADALCDQWNLVGVDLHHEPHKATWGQGPVSKRWDEGAKRLGNHVLSRCARWLVFVQGISYGAPHDGGSSKGYWWGENLVGAIEQPIVLSDKSKLVYAPHIEGPSSYMQSYFRDSTFPSNMQRVWSDHFLEAKGTLKVPFVIGKMGGKFVDSADMTWQRKAVEYFPSQSVGIFYSSLNPTAETGGLLEDDWSTAVTDKLDLLSEMPSTDVRTLRRSGQTPWVLDEPEPLPRAPQPGQQAPSQSGRPKATTTSTSAIKFIPQPPPPPPPRPPKRFRPPPSPPPPPQPPPSMLPNPPPPPPKPPGPPPPLRPPPEPPPSLPLATKIAVAGSAAMTAAGVMLTVAMICMAAGCLTIKRQSRGQQKGRRVAAERGSRSSQRALDPRAGGSRRRLVMLEALVTTLHASSQEARVDIRMDHAVTAKIGVRDAMMKALRPWLGDALLKKGFLVYMHHAGRVEVVTKVTSLDDVVEADILEIVIQADVMLPPASSARSGKANGRHRSDDIASEDEGEHQPMFGGGFD